MPEKYFKTKCYKCLGEVGPAFKLIHNVEQSEKKKTNFWWSVIFKKPDMLPANAIYHSYTSQNYSLNTL